MQVDSKQNGAPEDPAIDEGEEVLRLAQGGDHAAMNRLLTSHRAWLIHEVRRLMSTSLMTRDDPEDIVQEVLLQASLHLSDVRDVRHFRKRLLKIAHHIVIDQARFHRRGCRDSMRCESLESGPLPGVSPAEPADPTGTPSSVVSRHEAWSAVMRVIARLRPEYREVIRLRDCEQLEWEDIRVRLRRRTIKAVQVLHRRARIHLASTLGLS